MTTEEKAKRYDEALNWMRELYPGLHGATKEDAEHFFPYLRKRGKLDGLCELRFHGRRPEWRYDTEGIAALVKAGKLDYKPR